MTPAARYGSRIYWHETAPGEPEPPLQGDRECDVAIIGGGFTGLWTAYQLKRAEPSLRVTVIEAAEIAFGASGRNGGFAMTALDFSLWHLARNHGDEAAKIAHEAVARSVDEIGVVCRDTGIDCDYHKGGLLIVATNPGQEIRVRKDLETAARLGLVDYQALTGDQCRALVRSPTYRLGYLEGSCATLHPARLVRGLKRVVRGMGVAIHEGTPMRSIDVGNGAVRVRTDGGSLRSDQAVIATNAWTGRLRGFAGKVIPMYTYILLSEPLTPGQRSAIGWQGRQGVEDKRNYMHYYRLTADGRILWGGNDGVVYRGLGIRTAQDRNERVRRRLLGTFRSTFPDLADLRFTHHWGGPVAITPPFVPYFGTMKSGRVHYGYGYNGHGVAPSHLCGRILASLALGKDTYRGFPFVQAREPRLPPRHITWLGSIVTRWSLLRQDDAMDAGRSSGDVNPWLMRVFSR